MIPIRTLTLAHLSCSRDENMTTPIVVCKAIVGEESIIGIDGYGVLTIPHIEVSCDETNLIYLYIAESHPDNIQLRDILQPTEIQQLAADPTSKVVISSTLEMVERYYPALNDLVTRTIRPTQLTILCLDSLAKHHLTEGFRTHEISGVTIETYNEALRAAYVNYDSSHDIAAYQPTRFSTLAKRPAPQRMLTFAMLHGLGILHHFNYSFNFARTDGHTPVVYESTVADVDFVALAWTHNEVYKSKSMAKDNISIDTRLMLCVEYLLKTCGAKLDRTAFIQTMTDWMKNGPYPVINDNHLDPYDVNTYPLVASGSIHLVQEAFTRPLFRTLYKLAENEEYPAKMLTAVITEKTWKPMLTRTPFIIHASPYILRTLRDYGFKTFTPFIDESYDEELDHDTRHMAVISEINRLAQLSSREFDQLIIDMQPIVIHNHERVMELIDHTMTDEFDKMLTTILGK